MTTLILDAQTGISGDMTVAALLDLGGNYQKLQSVLDSLPDQQFRISVKRVTKSALDACDFCVTLNNGASNNDHDMSYLFGKEPHHEPHHHHHDHAHRHLDDIVSIIDQTTATQRTKEIAKRIFTIVAHAEAKAHGVPIDEVHFHEVGALDSIVDILSVAVLIDDLNVDQVIVPTLGEGYGEIRCQHGMLPIPVPAVLHIAQAHGLVLTPIDCKGEFVTPTGAAIVAALKTGDRLPKQYKILKSGLGAGKREYERPSLLRATLIEPCEKVSSQDFVIELSTNIDDCSPELLGFTLDRLYEQGALEAWFTPVFTKKSRPAYMLTVLCRPENKEAIENVIFAHTTTIGIRAKEVNRRTLKRKMQTVHTQYGDIDVKVCEVPDENGSLTTRYYPEYESVKRVAQEQHLDLALLYRLAQNAAENAQS